MKLYSGPLSMFGAKAQIALAEKKTYTLAVKPQDKDRVLEILGAYAPQATFGFSRDRQKQYRRNPTSLASHA